MNRQPALLARVLDELRLPVFVFAAGRQVYANDAAAALADRLRTQDRIELRVVLLDHIAALEGTRGPDGVAAPSVTLLTSQSGEPFYLQVVPVTRGTRRTPPTSSFPIGSRSRCSRRGRCSRWTTRRGRLS